MAGPAPSGPGIRAAIVARLGGGVGGLRSLTPGNVPNRGALNRPVHHYRWLILWRDHPLAQVKHVLALLFCHVGTAGQADECKCYGYRFHG